MRSYKSSDTELLGYIRIRIEMGWLDGGGMIAIREGEATNQSFDEPLYCLTAAIYWALGVQLRPDCIARNRITTAHGGWDVSIDSALGNLNERILLKQAPKTVRRFVHLLTLLEETVGTDNLEYWNDFVAQDKEEVLNVIDRAIELARQRA